MGNFTRKFGFLAVFFILTTVVVFMALRLDQALQSDTPTSNTFTSSGNYFVFSIRESTDVTIIDPQTWSVVLTSDTPFTVTIDDEDVPVVHSDNGYFLELPVASEFISIETEDNSILRMSIIAHDWYVDSILSIALTTR